MTETFPTVYLSVQTVVINQNRTEGKELGTWCFLINQPTNSFQYLHGPPSMINVESMLESGITTWGLGFEGVAPGCSSDSYIIR